MRTARAWNILAGYANDGDLPGATKLTVALQAAAVLLDAGVSPEAVSNMLKTLAQRSVCRLGHSVDVLAEAPFDIRVKLDRGEQLDHRDRSHMMGLESAVCVDQMVRGIALADAVKAGIHEHRN